MAPSGHYTLACGAKTWIEWIRRSGVRGTLVARGGGVPVQPIGTSVLPNRRATSFLQDVDEFRHDLVSAERRGVLAVDVHGGARLLERARAARSRCRRGWRLAGPIHHAAHHGHLETLGAQSTVCDAVTGQAVQAGDTYGLIRFGSRVDTYLPAGSELVIRKGQRTIGGETVLARMATAEVGTTTGEPSRNDTS